MFRQRAEEALDVAGRHGPAPPRVVPVDADAWSDEIGSVWAGLLALHRVGRDGTVIEIGPGFADKIARALRRHGFKGRLVVVEPNGEARAWVAERYRRLLPGTDLELVGRPLALVGSLPAAPEAIVLNHVLDDLVLRTILPASAREGVFARMRPESPTKIPDVVAAWQTVLHSPRRSTEATESALSELTHFVSRTRPRWLGVSQYGSSKLAEIGLGEVNRLGLSMIARLERAFGPTRRAAREALAHAGQNPRAWLFVEIGDDGR